MLIAWAFRCLLRHLEASVTTISMLQPTQMFLPLFPQLRVVTQKSDYPGRYVQTPSGDSLKSMRESISDAADQTLPATATALCGSEGHGRHNAVVAGAARRQRL